MDFERLDVGARLAKNGQVGDFGRLGLGPWAGVRKAWEDQTLRTYSLGALGETKIFIFGF